MHLLCADHAINAADTAARIIRIAAPDRMVLHEGDASALPCGHVAGPGYYAVAIGGQWMCENCATSR